MEKYYELTDNFKINFLGVKVFQIKCTKKIRFAEVGDLGGWIENEKNVYAVTHPTPPANRPAG